MTALRELAERWKRISQAAGSSAWCAAIRHRDEQEKRS